MDGTHPLGLSDRTFTVPFQPTRLGVDPEYILGLGRAVLIPERREWREESKNLIIIE
jgi:hypothetical protein